MADCRITVKTGDIKGAGTDANVYIILHGDQGQKSDEKRLDMIFRNDFERGSSDTYRVSDIDIRGDIRKIELRRDTRGIADDWYVDVVEVEHSSSKKKYVFPVHRWISQAHLIQEFDCCLPQNDPHPQQRRQELVKKKGLYKFESKNEEGLPPQIEDVPKEERFSFDYKLEIFLKETSKNTLALILKSPKMLFWDSLDDLTNIYGGLGLPKPAGWYHWESDVEFGMQRLAGCNPAVIRLCREIPENLGVTDEILRPVLEGLSIKKVIKQKRLYIINYEVLKSVNDKVCAPIALFFVNSKKEFVPVAIQLSQAKGEYNPVFLPTDPKYTWLLAKMHFNNADANFHQSCAHLGFTHLIIGSITVSTNRNLSPSHPLFRLLAPHFLYLLSINSLAFTILVNPGGWVDKTMAVGRDGMFTLIAQVFTEWRMDVDGTLPEDLNQRGVSDTDALPNYYYRDDALLLYDAIKHYVTTIVSAHYDDPEKIRWDDEIQAWGKELVAPMPEGCGIKGVPGNGSFRTVDQIVQTVTSIIFISSAVHAAVNFGQYEEYGFPPNYPGKLRGEPPTSKVALDEQAILDQLPNKASTLSIIDVTKLLSTKGTNSLGDFEVPYQYDPIGEMADKEFKKRLAEIGDIIDNRNKTRRAEYTHLHPKNVPNAISI
ncbi:allene oxide synthase-lipoxygenase protein-like [Ptychodera flava]|uniref:allene oxide synthase-lipoxygenase protein-like n=1 Tax=Ptychodera flava TaxID=63121 RepID=UPI00396A349B